MCTIRLPIPLLLLALAWCARADQSHPAVAHPSRPADRFVDSIGINVHLGYTDSTYARFEDVIKPRLIELGVRHARDACYSERPSYYRRINELGEAGIRFSLIADPRSTGLPSNVLEAIQRSGPAILSIEGPNELDLSPSPAWERAVREYQKALQRTLAGDPLSAHVVLLGPALGNVRPAARKVGDLSAYMDFGNAHPYPGGSHVTSPIGGGWGLSFAEAMEEVRRVSGTRPIVITETGYHNNLLRGSHPGVSEEAAARLLPRLLCHAFNQRVVRTYIYELADQRPDPAMTNMEHHFGLIRADGNPKPAYHAIRNLIRLLADPGPPFRPSPLRFALSSDNRELHQLLLQKRDGRFYLLLWLDVPTYDHSANRLHPVPERWATLDFPSPVSLVNQYTLADARPIATDRAVRTLRFRVTDQVLLLEITPDE